MIRQETANILSVLDAFMGTDADSIAMQVAELEKGLTLIRRNANKKKAHPQSTKR